MPSIIIIGSGPAGISAALYAVRAGVDTTVLTKGPGALDRAEKIENYYGFAEPVSGAELERRSIENAKRLGVRFVTAEAVGLTYTDKLTVETVDKNYPADAVILATGASRAVPRIPGLAGLEGHGVSYYCRLRRLFLPWKGRGGTGQRRVCPARGAGFAAGGKSVALLTNGAPLTADFPPEVTVYPQTVEAVLGETVATGVQLSGGVQLPVSGVFVALGVAGSTALARKIGAEVDGNRIVVDEKCRPPCLACMRRATAPAACCRWQRPCMRARRRALKPPRPCGKDEKQCRKQQRNTAIVWPKVFPSGTT